MKLNVRATYYIVNWFENTSSLDFRYEYFLHLNVFDIV